MRCFSQVSTLRCRLLRCPHLQAVACCRVLRKNGCCSGVVCCFNQVSSRWCRLLCHPSTPSCLRAVTYSRGPHRNGCSGVTSCFNLCLCVVDTCCFNRGGVVRCVNQVPEDEAFPPLCRTSPRGLLSDEPPRIIRTLVVSTTADRCSPLCKNFIAAAQCALPRASNLRQASLSCSQRRQKKRKGTSRATAGKHTTSYSRGI